MLEFSYLFAISIALLAMGIAGIATNKHFVIILLCIELILVASMISIVAFFSYTTNPNSTGVVMLISIWAVATVEIMTLVAFYIYMKHIDFDFDITKLSKLKW